MSIKEYPPHNLHIPVLLDKVIDTFGPKKGESYLDLTAGYGGHASKILEITGNYKDSVLVDRDDYAIEHLKSLSDLGVRLIHNDFVSASKELIDERRKFDLILVDLGVSSPQLDQGERGFSFTNDGPLDMRMDRRQEVSAETIVNRASMNEIAEIIHTYGEESLNLAKAYAKAIVSNRPIKTTKQLSSLIEKTYRGKWKKTHPATRTFQALRIAVNDELGQVSEILPLFKSLLNKGGRVGIISFHSLEDRLVKRYLVEQKDSGLEADLMTVTKKPLTGNIYDVHNPRARSSKLRVAVKK